MLNFVRANTWYTRLGKGPYKCKMCINKKCIQHYGTHYKIIKSKIIVKRILEMEDNMRWDMQSYCR